MPPSVYSVGVDAFVRTVLFISTVAVTILYRGLPTLNFLILVMFLSSVVPIPAVKPMSSTVEMVLPRACDIIRLWLHLSLWIVTLLVHPFLVVFNFLFFSLLEEAFRTVVYTLRNASRNLTSSLVDVGCALCGVQIHALFLVARVAMWLYPWVGVAVTVVRFVRRVFRLVTTVLTYLSLFEWMQQKIRTTIRQLVKLLLTLLLVFLVCPGPVAVGNYLATGHLYPGSVIRFKSWLAPAHVPETLLRCQSSFLDHFFASWTALRTVHFFLMTQVLACSSWTPSYRVLEFKQSLSSQGMVAMVTTGALLLALVMFSHNYVINQVLHILVAAGSLWVFVLVLDGYHQSHYLLHVYGIGTILVMVQDSLVVTYEVFSTVSSLNSVNLPLIAMSCATLWGCWTCSFNASRRIARKIANPGKSVL